MSETVLMTSYIGDFNNKKLVYEGKKYTCSATEASNYKAGLDFYYGTPIPWVDISDYLTEQNNALGFVDIMVTVIITNVYFTNYEKQWRIYADDDRRREYDLQVSSDNTLYELLDPTYKKLTYDQYNAYGYSKQFITLRFYVPRKINYDYKVYLGRYNLRALTYNLNKASLFQAKLYSPILTNVLIPVVDIVYPETKGIFKSEYDETRNILTLPERHIYIGLGNPVKFSGSNSYNQSGSEIISYKWDFDGDNVVDTTTVLPAVEHIYHTKGTYKVYLEVETASGITAKNNGSKTPSSLCDSAPKALPFEIEVIDLPKENIIYDPVPSPFVLEKDIEITFNYFLASDVHVKIRIMSLTGHTIKILKDSDSMQGYYTITWDGKTINDNLVGEGLYYYVFESGSTKTIKKIKIIR